MIHFLNNFFIFFLLNAIFYSCTESKRSETKIENSSTILTTKDLMGKAERLKILYQKARLEPQYKREFFNEFPNSFKLFVGIYGYEENDTNVHFSPLYDYSYEHVCLFFNELNDAIEDVEYYNKLINVCIGGTWQSDGVACLELVVHEAVKKELGVSIEILRKYSDLEIGSFWRFFFDGPHPDNYREDYKLLYIEVVKIDPSIAELMKNSYEELLSKQDGHGY